MPNWTKVPDTQTSQMKTKHGTFTIRPSRGYPRSRKFIVRLGQNVLEPFAPNENEAKLIAEDEFRRLEEG